ncbi:50S ribosomal protein L21 [Patescibacteria group bacterium]|nr:50S ribosomal protein L21 [Patescibacteria group bacterium]
MLAVIKTGGKQYIVSPGQKIKFEKIEVINAEETNQEVIFDEVLLLAYNPSGSAQSGEKNKKLEIGTPLVKDAKVYGKILEQGKGKKIIIFKHKAKKHSKTKTGHRQPFTEVEITKIKGD